MWPDRVSNPGPLTYVSRALPTALRGPAHPPLRLSFRVQRTLVITTLFVTKEFAVKSNLLL